MRATATARKRTAGKHRRGTAGDANAPTTRDLILGAAERHFAERGYAGISMRDIATDAGLKNQASLYHHFRDKGDLYEAVLTRVIEPVLQVVAESAAADGPAKGGWETSVDRLVVYLGEHPHLPRLIQRATLEDREHLPGVVPRLIRPLYQQGVEVLAATDTGWQRPDVPHLAAALYLLIFGFFANAALFEAVTELDPRSPGGLQRQRRFIRTALRRLLGSPAAER